MNKNNLKLLRFLVFGIGLLLLGSGYVYAQAVDVSLPALTVQAGTSGTIPLTVGSLTGKNVTAFQFTINYDKNVLYLTGASTTSLAMTGGTDPVVNADTANGKLVVAWARATAITGSGTLVNLNAQYRAVGTSALAFPTSGPGVFMFNAGTPAANVTDGSVTVPAIAVSFGTVTGVGVGDTVLIPISTGTLTAAHNVLSFDFVATYDKNIINVIDAVTTGTLSAGGTVVSNPNNTTGTVSVAWANSTKITGSGTLLNLRAKVVGRGTSNLAFTSFKYNAGTPTSGTINGSLVSANRAPVMTAVTAKTVAEGALLSFSVLAADADGDALTYSYTSSPAATGAAMTTAGAFTWTPDYTQAGTYTVTYKVTDALGLSDSSVSTITVTNVNRKPVFNAVAAQSAQAGNAYSLVVEAVDPDGDALTYSYVGTTPSGSAFTAATRTFAWTPTAAQVGAYTLKFRAADAGGLADTLSVALTVTKTNRPPVFVNQLPDGSLQTHVAFSFTYTAADPDLDVIGYYLVNPPAGAAIHPVTGVFTWTPVKSQIGTHDIVVLISDGVLSTNSRISKLTVTLFNNAPTWLAGGVPADTTIKENQTYTFRYRATDVNPGDVLKYVYIVRPTGAVIDSVTGIITWTPTFAQGRAAAYTNIVSVTDGYATTRDTSFITVQNVNRPPVFTQKMSDTMIVVNKLFSFKYIASDPDLDPIYYFIVSSPTGISINNLGTFFWTPTTAQLGIHNVVVGVRDYADTVKATNKISIVNVGVDDEGSIPNEYKLFQNYPNPFNPSTVIKYGIPKEAMVSLKIFNSIGEEITTLVNSIQQAGYYKYELDASKLNSGIYFYRLQAGDFVSIKKMMYLK